MTQGNKVSIIGAGHIGESCAFLLALKELTKEIVMVDIIDNLPQGKAIDMMQAAPLLGFDTKINGSNNFADIKDSDIVIMTA
ncbi:MAG: malate dehydrogenase, partial [Ignavibacteriales bacterium]|nr:malate dehydrogenase [Ignavibacteriales bacterium]